MGRWWSRKSHTHERACGYAARTTEPDDIDEAVRGLLGDSDQPALVQVMVDTCAKAYPKISFGRPITEMEPFSKPIEMESV